MQTQKEIQRSLADRENDVLLLTVPIAIMLQIKSTQNKANSKTRKQNESLKG